MSQLTQLFSEVTFQEPALWLALGSGFAVVLVFLFMGRRQRKAAPVVASTADIEPSAADAWIPPAKRPDERRRSTRRSGVPTPVHMLDPKKPKKPINGFVLDRSSGGVRIATEKPFSTGSIIQLRSAHAQPDCPWVPIIIRSCREVGDYFELGCQFQEELPWNLLLMFG